MDNERILIVEDEKIISLDLQRRLEKFGYRVAAVCSTGNDAVDKAKELRPDIILMDIMLGGEMDGIEAANRIKEETAIPVIFLTAYADEKTLQRAKEAEPFGYILKPFKERELYTTIDITLYKSRIHKELQRQERWYNSILHSVADALIAVDPDHQIQLMNPAAETLTGWTESTARGIRVSDVFQIFDQHTQLQVPVFESDGAPQGEGSLYFESVYLKNKQGAQIHIEGTVSPIRNESGEIEGTAVAFRDVTDIKKMSDTIIYQASHDALTGLINRDELFSRLTGLTQQGGNSDALHCFLYVDLDQFKLVNDVCGHQAGDELLLQVSRDLLALTDGNHTLGRLGGDEFGLILHDTGSEQGLQTARQVLQLLNRKFIWQKSAFHITASIGLIPVSGSTTDAFNVLAAADDACLLAKEQGGNTVQIYQTADYKFLKRRGEMQWISRLTHALEEDRFVLYFQPIVSLNGKMDEKKEILIRLKNNDGQLVSPGDFIPAAERYNLMPQIDRWVLREVMHYARKKQERDGDCEVYCINISGASLADETLLDFIITHLKETGTDPHAICLEITETTAIQNLSRAVGFMKQLRRAGVTFALDDFGNGFSSFAYLKSLPVDYLKIDGSFVKDIDGDPIDLAMVEAVNSIGHVMGMKTIAEYVKDQTIMKMLRKMGVDYAQGFAIAAPEPLPELTK